MNVIERVNQLLHDDDPAARGIPDTAMANAEILELIGLDDAGLLSQWVSFDRSRVRISVGAPEQAFSTRRKVLEGLRAFARSELPASWQVVPTGRVAMQHAWIEDVQSTQLRSFPTALLLVALLLAFFLRSLWLALAAVVPTVLPIVVTLGAMGFAGVTLDVGRAMIAAILLGVGVDDAVHVLHWYRQSRSEGVPARDAIRHAIRHNGRAVVTTSVALALGFLTLMASAWQSIASFGLLAAVAILGALAASLFVLPALIFVAAKGTGRSADAPPTDSGSRARRRVVAAFLAFPIAAMLALSSTLAVLDTREWVSPCWLLPRAHVVAVSGSCPLRLLDEIRWVAGPDGEPIETRSSDRVHRVLRDVGPVAHMQVIRQGRPRLVEVPLAPNTPRARAAAIATAALVALGLLALPLRQVVRAPARGALPFGIYSVAIAVSLVPAIGGQHSSALDRVALVAFVSAPAALAQLAMVFPVESRIVRLAPRLQLVPWISLGLLAAVSLPALERAPVLWPAFVYLVFSLHAGLWSVLVAACLFAPREAARRAEERATWERQTTTARVATNLLQDLGKDLGWMRGLARRMERRANCDPETRGAAGEVATLASDLAQRMRSFVELARSRQHDPPDVARLDEVIERCIHDLNERCGGGRFRSTHEPGLCAVRCPYRLADSLRDRLERTLRGDLHETEDELWLRARVDGDGSLHVTLTAADGSVRASLNLAMCGWDG